MLEEEGGEEEEEEEEVLLARGTGTVAPYSSGDLRSPRQAAGGASRLAVTPLFTKFAQSRLH